MSKLPGTTIEQAILNIDNHAAAWVVRALSDDMPNVEQQILEKWLASDIRHRQLYMEYMSIITLVDSCIETNRSIVKM